jgi:CrcB protein
MERFLCVGLGGFLGSCARYFLTNLMRRVCPLFPLGTLLSNVAAGLAIGLIIGAERHTAALPERTRLLLTTGLLGGLSTFSTFSLETVQMFEEGRWGSAAGNLLLNVGLSLAAVLLGLALAAILFVPAGRRG